MKVDCDGHDTTELISPYPILPPGTNPRQHAGDILLDYAWGEMSGVGKFTYKRVDGTREIVEVRQPASPQQASWSERPRGDHATMLANYFATVDAQCAAQRAEVYAR